MRAIFDRLSRVRAFSLMDQGVKIMGASASVKTRPRQYRTSPHPNPSASGSGMGTSPAPGTASQRPSIQVHISSNEKACRLEGQAPLCWDFATFYLASDGLLCGNRLRFFLVGVKIGCRYNHEGKDIRHHRGDRRCGTGGKRAFKAEGSRRGPAHSIRNRPLLHRSAPKTAI